MDSFDEDSSDGDVDVLSETEASSAWSAPSLSSPLTLATSSSSHREFHSSMASPLTTSSTCLSLSFMSLCEDEDGVSALVMTCDSTDLMMSLYGNDDEDDDECLLRASSSLSFSRRLSLSLSLRCRELEGMDALSSFSSPLRGVGEAVFPCADGRWPCKTVVSAVMIYGNTADLCVCFLLKKRKKFSFGTSTTELELPSWRNVDFYVSGLS